MSSVGWVTVFKPRQPKWTQDLDSSTRKNIWGFLTLPLSATKSSTIRCSSKLEKISSCTRWLSPTTFSTSSSIFQIFSPKRIVNNGGNLTLFRICPPRITLGASTSVFLLGKNWSNKKPVFIYMKPARPTKWDYHSRCRLQPNQNVIQEKQNANPFLRWIQFLQRTISYNEFRLIVLKSERTMHSFCCKLDLQNWMDKIMRMLPFSRFA